MPYRIIEQDGQFCIIKHAPDGSPIGEPLYCHDTRGEAEDQMSALYAAEAQSNVKAVTGGSEWALDVRGVPFDGPLAGKDAHGEFFDPETDLWLDGRTELPVVHYHGMRERRNDEVEIIGKSVRWWKEDDGWWFRVLLDKASNTAAKIWQAAKEGYARASSGATYHLTRSDKRTGRIKVWPLGELSLMDSRQYKPANDYAVALPAYKADEQSLQFVYERAGIPWPVFSEGSVEPPAGGTSTKEAGAGVGSDHPNQPRNNIMDLEQLMEIIRAALAPVIGTAVDEMKQMGEEEPNPENPDQQPPVPEELKMDGDQVDQVSKELLDQVAAKAAEILKKDSGFKQVTPETAEAWVKGVLDQHAEALMEAAFDARFKAIEARREMAAKAGKKALERFQKNAPAGAAKADVAGGVTKPAPDANGNGRGANITGVRNLKYAHLSAAEMAVGVLMAQAPMKAMGLNPEMVIQNFSGDYMRHLAVKAAEFAESDPLKDPKENYALKAAVPFKADEIMATNIAGQGTEWVPEFYSTQLWERARNTRIYQMLISKGMMVEELSNEPGSTAYFPIEGADPTVYTGVESNDLASGRPEVTASLQSLGTGRVSVSPKELKTAVAVTVTMDEDSIIATAPNVNRQLNEVMEDTVEKLMINGDTETGDSTNINLIDGTPASGVLTTPYYIASNGFLKLALITAPAAAVTSSRDAGGTLDVYDTLNTKKLYDNEIRAKLAKLAFILDTDTHDAHLALPQLTTSDVAARFATIQTGVIQQLWGIDVLVSGWMQLANSAGKVTAAVDGTLGRILSIYAPYWGMAWKRQITLETDRDILAGASLYVASMRLGVVARGNGAARVTYNVGVAI